MTALVPWHRALAWRIFLRTALSLLGLILFVLWVSKSQSHKQALESAEGGIKVSAQIMESSFENQGRIMEAGLEVFTTYSRNMGGIEQQDYGSVRESLLENLASLKSDVAMVIRPTGALLSCTTDGYKQDYSDVGIVDMAMHADDSLNPVQEGNNYRGYFNIDGGTYKGHYVGVARRLKKRDGEFLGVMVVASRLNDQAAVVLQGQSIVQLHPSDPASHVTLISNGEVIGTTVPQGASRNQLNVWLKSPAGVSALKEEMSKGRSMSIPLMLEDKEQLAMLVGMKGIGAESLQMAKLVTVPLDPFLRPFQKLQHAIVGAGALALVLALLLALTTARSVTAPLTRLTLAVGELAEGRRPELPQNVHRDEVGALARGFRTLLSELKAKEELLTALEQLRDAQVSQDLPFEMSHSESGQETTTPIRQSPEARTGPIKTLVPTARFNFKAGDMFAGRFRIDHLLEIGGMGMVVKAQDTELDEEVALKVIRPELTGDPVFLEQLKQEIKLARRISHKFVLRTHDYGEADGIPYVTMEYLKGITLKQLLGDKKRLPLSMVLRIGRQVTEGLQAAHAVGVVHRDIKPSNVMFDARGDVKLMDFGLAAPTKGRGTDSEGQIFGTPGYMSPEQVRGDLVDPRTDLYALGAMLFELSTGSAPFQAEERAQLLRLHLEVPPPDARDLTPSLPTAFSLLLRALLAKSKESRPASATEVLALLRQVTDGGAVETSE